MTAPYYQDDAVTIYHGDALELFPTLAPWSIAAVVTDPPYIIGAVSAGQMASKSGGCPARYGSVRDDVDDARRGSGGAS